MVTDTQHDHVRLPDTASDRQKREIIRAEISRTEKRLEALKDQLAEQAGQSRPMRDLYQEWASAPKGTRRGKASRRHVGELITKARAAGHTPPEIAASLGITLAYVYRLENEAKQARAEEELL